MFCHCCHWVTSTGLLQTDPATPFSLVMLLELLLGELGPEPGALLHADSIQNKHKNNNKRRISIYRKDKQTTHKQVTTK